MTRVFTGLAVGNLLVLLATAALGLFNPDESAERHVLLAVFSLLLTAFVQVLTFTYFTVTGKIIGQAVHLAGHDVNALVEVKRLKRAISHCLLIVLVPVVAVTVTGAAHWRTDEFGAWHLASAAALAAVVCLVFTREFGLIAENARLMAPAMACYEKWQRAKRARLGAGLRDESPDAVHENSVDK